MRLECLSFFAYTTYCTVLQVRQAYRPLLCPQNEGRLSLHGLCVGGRKVEKKESETDPNNLGVTILCLPSPEVTLLPPSQSTALTRVPKVA